MNKNDRVTLRKAVAATSQGMEMIRALAEAETEKADNMSEGLSGTYTFGQIEEAAGVLELAADGIETAISELEELLDGE